MPSYRAVRARVHLAVTASVPDSESSTSVVPPAPTPRNVSLPLSERPLLLPGSNTRMHFLGPQADMPFWIVRASLPPSLPPSLPDLSGLSNAPGPPVPANSAKHSAAAAAASPPPPPPSPRPLAIHVSLAPQSFLTTKSLKEKPTGLVRIDRQDLHMAIFINGEFVAARLLPARYAAPRDPELQQVFSGRRVARLYQRPFCHVPPPPVTAVGGKHAEPRRAPRERWDSIGQSLRNEARAWSSAQAGITMPSAELLDSLAAIPMPEELESVGRLDGREFATVDVIITLGKGIKSQAKYPSLVEPRKILDPLFYRPFPLVLETPDGSTEQAPEESPLVETPMQEPLSLPQLADVQMVTRGTLRKAKESSPSPPNSSATDTDTQSPVSTPTPAAPKRGSRSRTPRSKSAQPLAKNASTIPSQTGNAKPTKRTAASLDPAPTPKPPTSSPQPLEQYSSRKRKAARPSKLSNMILPSDPPIIPTVSKSEAVKTEETQPVSATPVKFMDPSIPCSEQVKLTKNFSSVMDSLHPWEPNTLHSNCALTYKGLEECRQQEWGEEHLERIPTERLGYITESEILMAVRFVVD